METTIAPPARRSSASTNPLRHPGRWPLEARIPLTVGLVLTVLLAGFSYLGLAAVQDSRERALEQQLLIARAAAEHIDQYLRHAQDLLKRAAAAPLLASDHGGPAEKAQAVSALYYQSGMFQKGLFLTDASGILLWLEPEELRAQIGIDASDKPCVSAALLAGEPVVSSSTRSGLGEPHLACIAVPVTDERGDIAGVLAGALDLSGPDLEGLLAALRLGSTGYVRVMDRDGVVLAAADRGELPGKNQHGERFAALISEKQEKVGTCHGCHEAGPIPERRQEVLAFAPIPTASWGVAVGQSEDEALAPARTLQQRLAWLTLLSVGFALLLAWMGIRDFTRPLMGFTHAAERIASGDLSGEVGVPLSRQDEIGRLAASFELMKSRLRHSVEEIQRWNRDLEARVQERTVELERSRQEIARLYVELQRKERALTDLLDQLINAQEEERKRIARELHDETSQALSALVFAAETAARHLGDTAIVAERLERMRDLTVSTLDGVHRLIFDLRPTLLDDLGLAAALRWYAESRLGDGGVRVSLELVGEERRLRSSIETAVYRAAQEAISNVAKHAEATNLGISLAFANGELIAEVEDDGRGFDQSAVTGRNSSGGLGLLGMRERMALVGGHLEIDSRRGCGTRVVIRVPLNGDQEGADEPNTGADSR